MKILMALVFIFSLSLSTSNSVFAAEKCTADQMKILEDLEFVDQFLDKHFPNECYVVEIFERGSKKNSCKANIKIRIKADPSYSEFPYEIIDCN